MNRYLIGVLYYGGIDREHDLCVQALRKHERIFDVMDLSGCPYIDQGRSMIATKVLDTPEIGGLLFIDHDMIFDPAEAIKVIEAAEECQGVAGAAYSMRRPGRIIGEVDGKKLTEGQKIVFFDGGGLMPASYLGMGMTAIHRSVLETLVLRSKKKHERQQEVLGELRKFLSTAFPAEPAYATLTGEKLAGAQAISLLEELSQHLQIPDLPRLTTGLNDAPVVPFFSHLLRLMKDMEAKTEGVYFGEDISFCVRCHEAELPVNVQTQARVFHKGFYHYGLEDVGMQVPFCDRLEVVAPKAPSPNPLPRPSYFSTNPDVQKALEATYGDECVTVRPRPGDLGLDPAAAEAFPESHDPLAPSSNGLEAHP
jgi:hypothetical protein